MDTSILFYGNISDSGSGSLIRVYTRHHVRESIFSDVDYEIRPRVCSFRSFMISFDTMDEAKLGMQAISVSGLPTPGVTATFFLPSSPAWVISYDLSSKMMHIISLDVN